MKVSVLGSGSKGNATFIEVDGVKILIDAGFSCKKIEEKLSDIGQALSDVDALFITHEHTDHISGAGIIARKYDIPIYITKESYEVCADKIGKLHQDQIIFIDKDDIILDDKLKISPFDVMHDAVRTVGFRLENQSSFKLAVSTDIGCINNVVRENFKDVDVMIIESNYDFNMLMNCHYPWDLKQRIKSRNGHLSNVEAAKFIRELSHDKLKKVLLAHISQDSNHVNLIRDTLKEELKEMIYRPKIEVTTQDRASEIFEIK